MKEVIPQVLFSNELACLTVYRHRVSAPE